MDLTILSQMTQVWIVASLTMFVISFLYSETVFYRIAEHAYVGGAGGHFIVIGLTAIYSSGVKPIQTGDITYVVPIIFGIMLFSTYSKKIYWSSRYPLALLVGVGTGLALRGTPKSLILDQIVATVIVVGKDSYATLNNVIIWIAVITASTYFIFTREMKGPITGVAKVGRYFMLVGFGAAYGAMILLRLGQFVPRAQFLLSKEAILPATLASILIIVVLGYPIMKKKRG